MTETNQQNCILGQLISTKNGIKPVCVNAGTSKCNKLCMDYNMLHGSSGKGGKIGEANIPEDNRLLTVQTSPVRKDEAKVYRVVDKYIESFEKMFQEYLHKNDRIRSLYLYSEKPGTGKTSTACAILNEYILRHYTGSIKNKKQPEKRIGYYLDVNEWQNLYVGFTRPNVPEHIAKEKSQKFYEQMELAKESKFVVLDDLAVRTTVSDAFRGELHSIINHRISGVLPTVYTSNVPLAGLPEIFGEERLYDRVRHFCIQLDFEGESQRGLRK